jgi:nitroreductase
VTVDEALRMRRSARRYLARDVPDGVLVEILDLARHAPSSMDGQPWRFLVIRDRARLERLAALKNAHCPPDKRDYPADFLADAPVAVIVAVDRADAHGRGCESGILATAWLLLAAHARGLSGVYLTAYNASTLAADLAALVGLPGDLDPITIVPLGYRADVPRPKSFRPLAAHLLPESLHDGRLTGT